MVQITGDGGGGETYPHWDEYAQYFLKKYGTMPVLPTKANPLPYKGYSDWLAVNYPPSGVAPPVNALGNPSTPNSGTTPSAVTPPASETPTTETTPPVTTPAPVPYVIPTMPTTAPSVGYHWTLWFDELGVQPAFWYEEIGTVGVDEQIALANYQLNQAEFAYKQEYDKQVLAWQKEQAATDLAWQKEQAAQNQANADREFQASLESIYAQLQQNPANWIVASEYLQKIKPGEASALTVPNWMSKYTGQIGGTPLKKTDITVPSGKDWNTMTPTQKAMLGGYSTWTGGGGASDIAATVQQSLPQKRDINTRWKPTVQV